MAESPELPKGFTPIQEEPPLPSGFTPLKKKAQPIDSATGGYGSAFGSANFQGTKPLIPTPLVGKGVEEYKEKTGINKREAEAKKLSDKLTTNLATYYSKQGEEGFINSETAKLQSDYNQLQAVIQKDLGNTGSRAGHVYNQLLAGIGGAANGLIDFGLNQVNQLKAFAPAPISAAISAAETQFGPLVTEESIKDYRRDVAPIVKNIMKDAIGANVDLGQQRKYNEEFLTGAVGGLAYSAPAMLTPYGVGLYAQAYDSGIDLINSSKYGKDLTEKEKTLFGTVLGGIMGKLENVGLNRILGRAVAPDIANAMTFKVIKQLGESGAKKITAEAVEKAADIEARSLKNRLLNLGDQSYKAFLDESTTGLLQEVSTIGLEKAVNALKGKDIFDDQSMGEMFGRVLKSTAAEGVGGGILGFGKGLVPIKTKSYLIDKVSNAKTFNDVRNLLLEVEKVGQDNNYSPEQIDEVVSVVNDFVSKKERLPQDLTAGQTSAIIGLMSDRDELTDNLKELEAELNSLDDALKPVKAREIELVKQQIATANQKIAEISQNPEYAVQESSPASQVPSATEGGQVVTEGGEGVGQSIEGTQAPQEAPIQEPTAEVIPEEEVVIEPTGVAVTNKASLNDLRSRVSDAVKVRIINTAEKAINTLKSVLPEFDIVIHDTPESYNAAMGQIGASENTRGNFSYTQNPDGTYSGTIDINLSNANARTVAHEVAHAVMLKAFGDSPNIFKGFRDKVSTALTKSRNEELINFSNRYVDQETGELLPVNYEEYLAELTAILEQQQDKISPTVLQQIASYINEVVVKLTNGKIKPFENIKDTKDVIDFFNTVSGAIREGAELDVDGITGKIKADAEPGPSVDVSSLKNKATLIEVLGLDRYPEMKDRIRYGYILKDLGDITAHLTYSDRLVTGKSGNSEYYGGIFFASATNSVWSNFKKTKVDAIIKGMVMNSDGYRYLMPALLSETSHMSNKDMLNTSLALVELAILNKNISVEKANQRIEKSLSISGLSKFKDIYLNKIGDSELTPELVKEALDDAMVKSSSTFENRKEFLKSLLGNAEKNLELRFGNLPTYNGLANGLAEPVTAGHEFGDVLLVIRTKGDLVAVQPKPGDYDYHPSYPWVIRSLNKDGSPADVETLVFKNSYNAADIFPEVKKANGEVVTYKDYEKTHGENARYRYNQFIGGIPQSTNVSEKVNVEAPKKLPVSKSQVVVAGVKYTVPSQEEQDALREERTEKSYFDNKVSELPSSPYTDEELTELLSNGEFGILTGQNPMGQPVPDSVNNKLNKRAKRWINRKGYDFSEVAGKYEQTEGSLLVPGLSTQDAIDFAKEFNQESVVTNDGLIYQDGSMNPRVKEEDSFTVDVSNPETDFASAIKLSDGSVKGFSIGLNFDETVQSPVSKSQIAEEAEEGKEETGVTKKETSALAKVREGVQRIFGGKSGEERKRLGASRIVGQAIQPEEFTEFEEVPDERAEAMLRDSIETPFRNKEKLDNAGKSWVSRFIKAAFESQIEAIDKLIKKGGDVGRIAKAALKNRKGYNGLSSIVNMKNNKDIFDNLGITPNIELAGRKVSESDLFDVFLNLTRIINIDNRIAEKFSQLVGLDKMLKDGIKSNLLSEEQIKQFKFEIETLKDYLEKRKALRIVNGKYEPVQYVHSGGRTAASARAELAVIKAKLPDVYNKLDDLAFKYNDAYRSLLDEQYKNNMISKDVYDELYSYNYIPTKYIQHFIETELSQDNPALASKLSSSIKNLTGGSDSDVITNFKAILELYTNSVYRRIYENRAATSLARAVRDNGMMSKGLMKTNQAMTSADARLSKNPMYNINLDMYIQEPTGKDKFGNPTYGDVPTGYDVIYFYESDGKRERIVAPKDFVDSWYDRGGQLGPFADKWINRISKWSLVNLFKALITKHNPAFGIYQILMDAPQALIATDAYKDFILGSALLAKDYASVSKDIFKFVRNNELTPLFKEAIDAGIFSDFLSTENDILRSQSLVNADGSTNYNTTAKLIMAKLKKGTDSALDGIAKLNEGVEYSTRLAVYKRMKQNLVAKYTKENNGIEPSESQMFDIRMLAAEQARNVVDFSRSGTVVKPLNKVLAYLNAGMQAFYASARSLKNNPTKAAVMLTEIGLSGVSVLAMSLGAGGDEKERKRRLAEYLMLSKYQRSNYFNIYNPYSEDEEKRWVRIPKPQMFRGYLNMMEQGYLNTVMGVDIDESTIKEAFLNDLPVDPVGFDLFTRNPMINAIVKYELNKDAFRDEEVVKDEEKIEDWAEGANDKSVSKLYKKLGEYTNGIYIPLIGTEGFSPKRSQAFVQSLIGDPSRNTTTAVLDKAGKTLFYSITGNEEGLKEEFTGDVADDMLKLTGLKGRIFAKTPKVDNTFMETLRKEEKAEYTTNYIVRGDVKEIRDAVKDPNEGLDLIFKYLKERVAAKDIKPEYAQRVMNSQKKLYYVKDAPYFYDDVMIGKDNDSKAKILNNYIKDMSDAEVTKVYNDMLINKLVAREVIDMAIELRESKNK